MEHGRSRERCAMCGSLFAGEPIKEIVDRRRKQFKDYVDAFDPNMTVDKKYRRLEHEMDVNYNTLKNFYAGANISFLTMYKIDEFFAKKESE